MKAPPWLLLSDVHLGASPRPEREAAVERLLAAFPGVAVAFVGDLFEFASCPEREPKRALRAMLQVNDGFVAALRRHAQTGAEIHWIAGNHDAALAAVGSDGAQCLGVPVRIWPWFVRFGDVHLEHGHVFDRDNAPLHPLACWQLKDEPLGVVLMREIVVGLDASAWAHAHQTTPSQALRQASEWFGWRLPAVAARAFGVLFRLSAQASVGRWGRVSAARRQGNDQLAQLAEDTGLELATLEALISRMPLATHATGAAVFRRLYLDWVSSAAVAVLGPAAALTTRAVWPWAGGLLAATYAAYVGYARRGARYPSPIASLRQGAHHVAALTGAKRVIFGHTHVEEDDGVYANLGSFGYPRGDGRPYALVTRQGELTRGHWRG